MSEQQHSTGKQPRHVARPQQQKSRFVRSSTGAVQQQHVKVTARPAAAQAQKQQVARPAAAQAQKQQVARPAAAAQAQQVNPYLSTKASQGATPLSTVNRARYNTRRKGSSLLSNVLAFLVLALLLGGALWWFLLRPKPFDVTFNGEVITVKAGTTVENLVDEGYANPLPGNLLAVDGSLLTQGEGERFSATIDGEKVEPKTKLAANMNIQVGDGGDLTEEATETQETIPFETAGDEASFESYWEGSIHLLSRGTDGVRTTRTGTISGITVSEVSVAPIDAGYQVFTVQTDEPVIALTFDDGPWPQSTDAILDILEQNDAKATFFTIGNQIAEQPESVKRAHDMGCEVLTHSWDHAAGSGQGVNMTYMSSDEQISEVTRGMSAIKDVTGEEPPHLMRAPGGNFYGELVTTLWPYLDAEIGWDIDTEDWRMPGVDAITAMILSAEPGQVILMHDGGGDRSQTVEALRQALPELKARGYRFVTISELLELNSAAADAQTTQ